MAPDTWHGNAVTCTGGAPGEDVPDILLVGFDDDTRAILATVFRHAGWHVWVEVEAARALDRARSHRPRLVVTNFPTDAGDGRSVTEALRADARTADLPVLSVTSRVFPAELEAAATAGVTTSLPMPIAPSSVLDEVRRLLGGPRTS